MQRYRRPLNPEHQQTHLPMGGLIRRRMKRLFLILASLLCFQVLVIWSVEDLSFFESVWITMTTVDRRLRRFCSKNNDRPAQHHCHHVRWGNHPVDPHYQ
jgi:hypothetical protein